MPRATEIPRFRPRAPVFPASGREANNPAGKRGRRPRGLMARSGQHRAYWTDPLRVCPMPEPGNGPAGLTAATGTPCKRTQNRGRLPTMSRVGRILTAPFHVVGRVLTGIGKRLTGRS
jgi:hypothetical protein